MKRIVFDVARARELYQTGLTTAEIARELGACCANTIHSRLRQAGVSMRKARPRRGLVGKRALAWKGGRAVDAAGYVYVYLGRYGKNREHRLVMEIGRAAGREECRSRWAA